MEETEITITLTFTGEKELTKSQIWEFIDDKLQDEEVEIDGDEYQIAVANAQKRALG